MNINLLKLNREIRLLKLENSALKNSIKYSKIINFTFRHNASSVCFKAGYYIVPGLNSQNTELPLESFIGKVFINDQQLVRHTFENINTHSNEIEFRFFVPGDCLRNVRVYFETEYDSGVAITSIGFLEVLGGCLDSKQSHKISDDFLKQFNSTDAIKTETDALINHTTNFEIYPDAHKNILIAVAEISQNFLMANGWKQLVEIAIEQLAQASSANRVYLYKNIEDENEVIYSHQIFMYLDPSCCLLSEASNGHEIDCNFSELDNCYQLLSTGNIVVRSISTCSPIEREYLVASNVLSILIIPLFIRGKFWGFIGFDDCINERIWADAVITALKSAAVVISVAIEREQYDQDLRRLEQLRLAQSEKQKDLLVREVHHRIKNHLQGLIGLLKQRKNQGAITSTTLQEAISQIESIAVVYGLQATDNNSKIVFDKMISAIISSTSSLSQHPISIAISLGDKKTPYEVVRGKAVALALIINEMLMNAIKHYHCSTRDSIKIECKQTSESYILSISNPGFLPEGFDFNNMIALGTGLELAKSMLPSQGAKLDFVQKKSQVVAVLSITSPLLINN